MDLTLQELLNVMALRFEYTGERKRLSRSLAGISTDSRNVLANEVYFALRGEHYDGHNFVEDALKKGALAAVVEKTWSENHERKIAKPIFVVDDTLKALQELSRYYRTKFSLPVLGLTGTNGKTTTKEMIAAVLSTAGNVCKTAGNLNNHIGVPLTLFKLARDHRFAVVEMGTNHFGEITRLCEIAEPNLGVITNIGRGHLEFLGNLEGVARAKMELFDSLPADAVAFVNLEDSLIVKHSSKPKNKITYGFRDEARVIARVLEPDPLGFPRMRVEKQIFTLNVFGNHNLLNALAAVAVGLEFGVSLKTMKTALANVSVPGKRLEVIKRNDRLILNDSYNANPDSTLAALAILKEMKTTGKRIFVFGDMLELGEAAAEEHARIGNVLRDFNVNLLLAFGPLAAKAVDAARQSHGVIVAQHFADKQDLIAELKKRLATGDVLLVKGSRSMKMEDIVTAIDWIN